MFHQPMTRRTAFVAALKGAAALVSTLFIPAAMADTSSRLQMGYEEQGLLYKELLEIANRAPTNPLVAEMLKSPENRRLATKYLAAPPCQRCNGSKRVYAIDGTPRSAPCPMCTEEQNLTA